MRQTASGHLGWYTILSLVVHVFSLAWVLRALPLATPIVPPFEPVRVALVAPTLPESPHPMAASGALSPAPAAFPSPTVAAMPPAPTIRTPGRVSTPEAVRSLPTPPLPPQSPRFPPLPIPEQVAPPAPQVDTPMPPRPPTAAAVAPQVRDVSVPPTELAPPRPLARLPVEHPKAAAPPLTAPSPTAVSSRPSLAVTRLAIPEPPDQPPPSKAATARRRADPTSRRVSPQAIPAEPSPRQVVPPPAPAAPLPTASPVEPDRPAQQRARVHEPQPTVAAPPALAAASAGPTFPPSHPGQPAPSSPGVAAHDLGALFASKPCPLYPSMARRRGSEGTVVLEFDVLAGGQIGDIRVSQSSGHYLLDNAAQNAVKKWRAAPEAFNGRGTTRLTVPFTFELERPDGSKRHESNLPHSDQAIICDGNTKHS